MGDSSFDAVFDEAFSTAYIIGSMIGLAITLIATFWVYNDSKERNQDNTSSCLWGCAVFLFTLPALVIYLLLRSNTPTREVSIGSPVVPYRNDPAPPPAPRLTQQVNYDRAVNTKNMVNCEYCGASIRPIAIRCPHCHEDRSEFVDQAFKRL